MCIIFCCCDAIEFKVMSIRSPETKICVVYECGMPRDKEMCGIWLVKKCG